MVTYICVDCLFRTTIKVHYNKHLETQKHKRNTANKETDTEEFYFENDKYYCIYCYKDYKILNDLKRHQDRYCKKAFIESKIEEHNKTKLEQYNK